MNHLFAELKTFNLENAFEINEIEENVYLDPWKQLAHLVDSCYFVKQYDKL